MKSFIVLVTTIILMLSISDLVTIRFLIIETINIKRTYDNTANVQCSILCCSFSGASFYWAWTMAKTTETNDEIKFERGFQPCQTNNQKSS
jgi:hypothetical protein